ncbi:response regulator [Ornatilinea apprima]|nr:response regulator [Ornatilinea apprima]
MAKILFLDDDVSTLQLMKMAADVLGHQIVTATCVSEAIQLAGSQTPDLIFADLGCLQDMEGNAFIHQFCHSATIEGVPVIIVSAGWSGDDAQRVEKNGHCCFMNKPVTMDQMDKTVKKYVQSASRP